MCPRSVIQTKEPINRERLKAQVDSAAFSGQMLHLCLEVFINNRVNLRSPFEVAYEQSRKYAAGIGMISQFDAMDKETMQFMAKGAKVVMTEVPMLLNKNGTVRRAKYYQANSNDILVGTADCIIQNSDGSFTIADWKTGMDDVDPPSKNHQLIGLAYMAQAYFGFTQFYLQVNNPITKQATKVGPFSRAQFDISGFSRVDKTRQSAGDHCRYCPLRGNCVSFSMMVEKECNDVGLPVDGFFNTKHD